MGYLNSTTVSIDAILTKKGRELLAKNDGSFKITQFALSDDEVDYTLYNPTHPSGSAFYGEAIENMPVLEAFPDETQIMKYKLITLPRGTAKLPVINIGYNTIVLRQGASLSITPQTLNYLGASAVFESSGYTATISDIRTLQSINGAGINTPDAQQLNSSVSVGTNVSKTVIGTSITLTGTTVNVLFGGNTTLYTTLTIVGRDSGARLVVPVQITKVTS